MLAMLQAGWDQALLWLQSQNPLNIFLALLAGGGMFSLVMGLLQRSPVDLLQVDRTYSGGKTQPGWSERLQRQLDDARLEIRPREFVLFMVGWSLGAALLLLLATRLPIGAVFGAALGAVGYWFWLRQRAARNRAEYESQLAQVVARLISGAASGNTFLAAVQHAARFGPEICRSDWAFMAEQLALNVPPEHVFKALSDRRRSGLLNLVLELLLLAVKEGAPLSQTLPAIQKSLEDRHRIVARARTEFDGQMRDMVIVATVPFLLVIAYGWLSPTMAGVYATVIGQIAIGIGWMLTVAAVYYVYRFFDTELADLTNYTTRVDTNSARPTLSDSADAGPTDPAPVAGGRHG